MGFQWLEMRISEEQDRRTKESQILERLPRVMEELHDALAECLEEYTGVFGKESAEITLQSSRIHVSVRELQDGKWQQVSRVDVSIVPSVPGFQIERESEPLIIEIGLLPGEKAFYRDQKLDKYLGMEELTRRILDRALFPRLSE
ncbi:MAG TPA: hypothetical protein VKU19_23935 [Bryobacteraceae bacterium]|nr:hypothetical protein [Bryobacteraceae bacterium]